MKLLSHLIATHLVLLNLAFTIPAQTFHDDSLVVVEILVSNGLDTVSVASVTPSMSSERIETLSLDRLGLKELPPAIGRLSALKILTFSNNRIATLPESFGHLNLTYLNASDNLLYALPESFSNLDKLEYLYLTRNRFTRWPAVFDSMPDLPMIDLGGNNLTVIPEQIASYPNLKSLYICDNYLTALPERLSTIELEVVNVAGNALCGVSDALTSWLDTYDHYKEGSKWKGFQSCDRLLSDTVSVRILLEKNGWENIPVMNVVSIKEGQVVAIDLSPEARSAGESLRKQSTSANGTLIIPDNLTYLKYLESLNLSGNAFDSLPDILGEFCHLRHLNLSGNNFVTLPDFMVSFQMLDSLDLSGNMLASLPSPLEQWADTYAPSWKETQLVTGSLVGANNRKSPRSTAVSATGFATGMVRMVVNLSASFTGEAALYALSGRKIAACSVRHFSEGKNILQFNSSRIGRGTYLFRITGDGGINSAEQIALF